MKLNEAMKILSRSDKIFIFILIVLLTGLICYILGEKKGNWQAQTKQITEITIMRKVESLSQGIERIQRKQDIILKVMGCGEILEIMEENERKANK